MPLDEIRSAFWLGIAEAFPEGAEASETQLGHLLISYPMPTERRAHRRSREVLVVLQPGAIARMAGADAQLRRGIALAARDTVSRALQAGYDPEVEAPGSFHVYMDDPELGY